jgi:hypothetical protein
MSPNEEHAHVVHLLKENYDAPPPNPEFVQSLGLRLQDELAKNAERGRLHGVAGNAPAHRGSRSWRMIAGAAAMVLLGIGIGSFANPAWFRGQTPEKIANGDKETAHLRLPATTAKGSQPNIPGPIVTGKLHPFDFPDMAELVGRSTIVVRGTFARFSMTGFVCDVNRVLVGPLPVKGKTQLEIRLNDAKAWAATARANLVERGVDPTDAEVLKNTWNFRGFEVGNDVVLFLVGAFQDGADSYYKLLDDSTNSAVAKSEVINSGLQPFTVEADIFKVLQRGGSLDLWAYGVRTLNELFPEQKPDELREHLRHEPWLVDALRRVLSPPGSSEGIVVRAQLAEVTETSSRWSVTKVLHGKYDKDSLALDHTPFQRRAEAISRYLVAETAPADRRKDVQHEVFAQLLGRELSIGQNAILVVHPVPVATDKARYELVARAYDDPPHQRLNGLEQTITFLKEAKKAGPVPRPTLPQLR